MHKIIESVVFFNQQNTCTCRYAWPHVMEPLASSYSPIPRTTPTVLIPKCIQIPGGSPNQAPRGAPPSWVKGTLSLQATRRQVTIVEQYFIKFCGIFCNIMKTILCKELCKLCILYLNTSKLKSRCTS